MAEIAEAGKILDHHSIAYRYEEDKSGNYIHFQDPDGTLLYFVKPGW